MSKAKLFRDSRLEGVLLGEDYLPGSLAEAYKIQSINSSQFGAIRAWKLGGTNLATRRLFSVEEAYYGAISEGAIFENNEIVTLPKKIAIPSGEAEVCFRLTENIALFLEEGFQRAPMNTLVDKAMPSIEMPWSVFPLPQAGVKVLLADCCAAGLLVTGPPIELDDEFNFSDDVVVMKLQCGTELAVGSVGNIIGGPLAALRDFLVLARAHKLPLDSGQLVATGGCTPCVKLPLGEEITVDFSCLGSFSFSLER